MEGLTLPIYNSEGKETGILKLSPEIFDGKVNDGALYQAVNVYLANQRKGLASTKTRGEVSGGGKKPWRQKGTGRARVGSIRSPLWRNGGVIFGPHPRDYGYDIPKKIKLLALKSALNARLRENNFIVLGSLELNSNKTKDMVKIFSSLKIVDKDIKKKTATALLLVDKIEKKLQQATDNIEFIDVAAASDINAYEVLRHKKIIVTEEALRKLTERLKR
ncbi:MAG: 50S ribosomal protein L4 [Candidatus Omnitrophica bacterium]|nr:50S ribosomal protein L4 [Candidatus Omnitrophota bacterium]